MIFSLLDVFNLKKCINQLAKYVIRLILKFTDRGHLRELISWGCVLPQYDFPFLYSSMVLAGIDLIPAFFIY